eukprot:4575034-Pleurochrysis_carterae.AAC.3
MAVRTLLVLKQLRQEGLTEVKQKGESPGVSEPRAVTAKVVAKEATEVVAAQEAAAAVAEEKAAELMEADSSKVEVVVKESPEECAKGNQSKEETAFVAATALAAVVTGTTALAAAATLEGKTAEVDMVEAAVELRTGAACLVAAFWGFVLAALVAAVVSAAVAAAAVAVATAVMAAADATIAGVLVEAAMAKAVTAADDKVSVAMAA